MELIDRDGKDLFVGSLPILHHQRADRPATNDCSRYDRGRAYDQHIDRVAVLRQGVRHKAVIAGIKHRSMQEAVDEHRPRRFVDLVLDGLAPLRDLDNDVDVVRRCAADRDLGDVHLSACRYGAMPLPATSRRAFSVLSRSKPIALSTWGALVNWILP